MQHIYADHTFQMACDQFDLIADYASPLPFAVLAEQARGSLDHLRGRLCPDGGAAGLPDGGLLRRQAGDLRAARRHRRARELLLTGVR